jgi:hypothetical protein
VWLCAAEADRQNTALDERVGNWTQRHPGIDTQIVHSERFIPYVRQHRESIRLVVVGNHRRDDVVRVMELSKQRRSTTGRSLCWSSTANTFELRLPKTSCADYPPLPSEKRVRTSGASTSIRPRCSQMAPSSCSLFMA